MNEGTDAAGTGHRDGWGRKQTVSWSKGKKKEMNLEGSGLGSGDKAKFVKAVLLW